MRQIIRAQLLFVLLRQMSDAAECEHEEIVRGQSMLVLVGEFDGVSQGENE